jgi:hypothetical protein
MAAASARLPGTSGKAGVAAKVAWTVWTPFIVRVIAGAHPVTTPSTVQPVKVCCGPGCATRVMPVPGSTGKVPPALAVPGGVTSTVPPPTTVSVRATCADGSAVTWKLLGTGEAAW